MKLIFVKNLNNIYLCKHFLNFLLNSNYKNNTKSFIKVFMDICELLNLNHTYVIDNINSDFTYFLKLLYKCCQFGSPKSKVELYFNEN